MIGKALKLIRTLHDLSLTDLAAGLETSPGYLSEIENGKKQPTIPFINKFAQYFKISPSSIMFFSEVLSKSKVPKSIRSAILKFLEMIENGKA